MPIEVQCPTCGKRLRAPDEQRGRTAKCPQCQGRFVLEPAEVGDAAQGPSADASSWRVLTGENEEYGPVSKAELDQWLAEGRLDAGCQVRRNDWNAWKRADEVYPQLQTPATAESPADLAAALGLAPRTASQPGLSAAPSLLSGGTLARAPADENLFTSPAAFTSAGESFNAAGDRELQDALRETKPWVLLFAILGFIVGGMSLLGCIGMLFVSLRLGIGPAIGSLFYLAGVALYLTAALYLYRYSQRIGDYLRLGSQSALTAAIVAQKSFWKLVGILTAIGLVLGILSMFLGFAGAFFFFNRIR